MLPDATWLSLPLLASFIAMPACAAWRRRHLSRLTSEAATELTTFAHAVRRESRCLPLDAALRARLIRLRVREWPALQLAQELAREDSATLADAAQRLALRLRRRVAFDRKMLARTASGLKRGAIAASIPPAIVLMLLGTGLSVPGSVLAALFAIEAFGCGLLWRLSSLEI